MTPSVDGTQDLETGQTERILNEVDVPSWLQCIEAGR